MTMMFRAFGSEWVKLRRRTLLLGTYAALSAIAALFTVLVFARAGHPSHGDRDRFVSLAELARPDGLVRGLDRASVLFGIVAFGVAAAQTASEYTLGTIRQLLVRQPRRATLIAGKHVAIVTFLAGALVLAMLSAGIAAAVMANARGIPTSAWTSSTGLADLGRSFGNIAVATAGFATLGTIVGLTLRSPVLSVMMGFVYLLIVENVLSAVVSGADRWLPGQLLNTIALGGDSTVGYLTALQTVAAYLAVAGMASIVLFGRRDVTS